MSTDNDEKKTEQNTDNEDVSSLEAVKEQMKEVTRRLEVFEKSGYNDSWQGRSGWQPFGDEVTFTFDEYTAQKAINTGSGKIIKKDKFAPCHKNADGYYDTPTANIYVLSGNKAAKKEIIKDAWKSADKDAELFERLGLINKALKNNKEYLAYLKDEKREELIVAHEAHHRLNTARGIYSASADDTWLGCEAFAKIDKADELGARLAEMNYIRDAYINAGGGEKGIKEIEKYSKYFPIPLYDGYMSAIKSGEINPLSSDPNDLNKEMQLMSKLANEDLGNSEARTYNRQYTSFAYYYAGLYNMDNIKKDEIETQRRCDAAMTIDMMINGERQPVVFSQKIEIDQALQTKFSTIDNNPDLLRECYENGTSAYMEKTQQMINKAQKMMDNLNGNYIATTQQNGVEK